MNWALSPSGGVLICDSIGSSIDNVPEGVMQKVWTVPQYGVMMGARNWAAPAQGIIAMLQRGVLIPASIEALAEICETVLEDEVERAPILINETEPCGFVIYLLGWSFVQDRAVGYQFSSEDRCKAHPLPDGLCLSPPLPEGEKPNGTWLEIAARQQELDDLIEPTERGNLGGFLTVTEVCRPRPGEGPPITARMVGTLGRQDELVRIAEDRLARMVAEHQALRAAPTSQLDKALAHQ
jgi:hypothetical protein